MKVAAFERKGERRVGVVAGDMIQDAGTSIFELSPGSAVYSLGETRLLPPVASPGKILCVGLNYRDHAEEAGQPIPKEPVLFAKFANAIIGPDAPIRRPGHSKEIDYEGELAVVIGQRARSVPADKALEAVFGYTCLNDVSARDLQFADGQWVRGKTQDTFCPLGPWIVTADEIPDPQVLSIHCLVNGEVRQDSSTKEMIFSVAKLISFITAGITLEPGDVIATGTPAGVGFARTPPLFLQAGDVVRVEIEAIGALENPVV